MYWLCKMCGRSLRAEESPNFCYFDRSDLIENISDEDAVKMGLFQFHDGEYGDAEFVPEFELDVKFDPFTGSSELITLDTAKTDIFKLSDFQDRIMEGVRK